VGAGGVLFVSVKSNGRWLVRLIGFCPFLSVGWGETWGVACRVVFGIVAWTCHLFVGCE